jgi:hypothetical protein
MDIPIKRRCKWVRKFKDLPVLTKAEYVGSFQYAEGGDGPANVYAAIVISEPTRVFYRQGDEWKKGRKYDTGDLIEVDLYQVKFTETDEEYADRVKQFFAELRGDKANS